MTQSTFDTKVLIEQVRCIESEREADEEDGAGLDIGFSSNAFEGRLAERAAHLVQRQNWQQLIDHAQGSWRTFRLLAGASAVLLGAVATLVAVSGDSTINIYWLLIVLLGFNLLSILLWVAAITLRTSAPLSGLFSTVATWLPKRLPRRDASDTVHAADTAWFRCHLQGAIGKWRFSDLTHGLWLMYLGTGLLVLMLVLSTRQYDFVWGTTLLSGDAFVQLTAQLARPLQALGFSTPESQHVLATRIGADVTLDAEHRYRWAQFLIGALLLYGITPRILLLLASRTMLRVARAQFSPDYYLPYYVQLRQQLLPVHGRSQVVDADELGTKYSEDSGPSMPGQASISTLPDSLLWVAVELSEAARWPLAHLAQQQCLGHVVDAASQQDAIEQLQLKSSPDLAIAVSPRRAPDRGLQRIIEVLSNTAASTWLVLLENADGTSTHSARLEDWFRLAQRCAIPADRVITIADR